MMETNIGKGPPPQSTDLDAWRQAVAEDRLGTFRMEGVVAAIQDLGPNADKSVINPLVLHTSETILRILRKHIGTNHRNEGNDIVEEAHGQLIQAIFTPNSADGKGLRQAFVPRIRFRAGDAIRADKQMRKRELSVENIHEVSGAKHTTESDPRRELDEQMDVEQVLNNIADDQKRLAFRLHMEGIPLESKSTTSIAKTLGVSSKTAGQWIKEVKAQLRSIVGEQS